MSNEAFSLLAEPIQRHLWKLKWTSLRPIQVDAIHAITEQSHDLVISSPTASGKTEAAFLPVLSRIVDSCSNAVRALYVGPLKALINDQFGRLEQLCELAEIPVHRWHGDVSGSRKQSFLRKPSGVLLITPESIESLFINRTTALTRVFAELSYVVIDELHAFVGSERGLHLRSLLFRLQRRAQADFRIIGLSATIGNRDSSSEWVRPGEPKRVTFIEDPGAQRSIHYMLHGYCERDTEEPLDVEARVTDDMFSVFSGSNNLVFANRKTEVESYADLLNVRCRKSGRPQEFLVHHGSLSREVREQTEHLMRESRPTTTICSSSLELGIDIGHVKAVGQLGPTWSVSSLVQRCGRSGRKEGEPSVMRVFIIEEEPSSDASLPKQLYPDLLQAIAMTELMGEKWLEPDCADEFDLSTCVQQILSVLAETGGTSALRLYQTLVLKGAFRNIDEGTFAEILRSMAFHDLIEQMPEGDIILGLQGQRIVGHYSFYSAFLTPEEYSVVHQGREIGSLPALYAPSEGDHVLLAAKRWEVTAVDHGAKEISVIPARGRKPPSFTGGPGEIHPRVRQEMRQVLLQERQYPYLNGEARDLLARSRAVARRAGIDRHMLIALNENSCLWFTWTGTKAQRTLRLLAAKHGVETRDMAMALHVACPRETLLDVLGRVLRQMPTADELAALIQAKQRRKYDGYLSEQLLDLQLASSALDLASARSVVSELLNRAGNAR